MNFRFGALGAVFVGLVVSGCASGGTQAPSTPTGFEATEELPDWVAELPEGTEPRDNEHTSEATLFLVQAGASQDEAQRENYLRQALQAAQAGIDADPGNPQAYYQAGEALLGLDRIEEGAAMLDRAEELYPRYVWEGTMMLREQAWIDVFNEGIELYQAGEVEAAIEQMEVAHSVYRDRPEAMINLGSMYAQVGRFDDASEMFGEVIELTTGPWFDRMDEEVQAEWTETLHGAQQSRARLLLRAERYADAAAVYEEILARDPDNLEHLSAYAAALVAAGESERARALFDDLLTRPDLDASDYYTIGVGLYHADEFVESARAFRETYDRVPEHRDAAFNLAQTLYLSDQWEELLEVTENLMEVDPYSEHAYRYRVQALVRADREQEAVALLEQMEALPFTVDDMGLQPGGRDVVLVGLVTNKAQDAGSSVRFRFHFYDVSGAAVGSVEESVQLGAEGQPVQFQVEAPSVPGLFGYRYEVLGE